VTAAVSAASGAPLPAAWQRYLDDLKSHAGGPVPLEAQGTLVRVAGLVLEAAGVRMPVGSVCEVRMEHQPPVLAAEVAGRDEGPDVLRKKARWYLDHGVEIVWLLYPERRSVEVITAAETRTFAWGETLAADPRLPGLAPAVADLFRQIPRPSVSDVAGGLFLREKRSRPADGE